MATIWIRDIPEECYEVLRRRARSEGRSIQSYMREHVVEFANKPTHAERVAAIEETLAESGDPAVPVALIRAHLDADRP